MNNTIHNLIDRLGDTTSMSGGSYGWRRGSCRIDCSGGGDVGGGGILDLDSVARCGRRSLRRHCLQLAIAGSGLCAVVIDFLSMLASFTR